MISANILRNAKPAKQHMQESDGGQCMTKENKIYQQTGLKAEDITEQMIKAKRQILKAKRIIKEVESNEKD